MIEIGRLNRRISVEALSDAQDIYGQDTGDWAAVCRVWANIKPINTRERVQGMAMTGNITHTIAIRYRASLADPKAVAAMRIKYGSRIFNIKGCRDHEEGHRFLILDCIEGSIDGK